MIDVGHGNWRPDGGAIWEKGLRTVIQHHPVNSAWAVSLCQEATERWGVPFEARPDDRLEKYGWKGRCFIKWELDGQTR